MRNQGYFSDMKASPEPQNFNFHSLCRSPDDEQTDLHVPIFNFFFKSATNSVLINIGRKLDAYII